MTPGELAEFLGARIHMTGFCWEWKRSPDGHGYGRITIRGRQFRAHRWVYEQLVGPIPDGLHLDHLCRNTMCVNPDHLEAVTHAVNLGRSSKALKRWCIRSHDLNDPKVVHITKEGRRRCRPCHAEEERARRARRAA